MLKSYERIKPDLTETAGCRRRRREREKRMRKRQFLLAQFRNCKYRETFV